MTIPLRMIFVSGLMLYVASAWPSSTKDEVLMLQDQVKALQEGQEQMQKDLDEIKKLLREGTAAAPSAGGFKEQDVIIGESPYKGDEGATLTLIEYSDYQCPYCARHYRDVMPTLVTEYVDTGKMKYVMREHPIASIHPNAVNASLAALCAQDQGRYWDMHNALFDNQKQLQLDQIKSYAAGIGLDSAAFDDCLDSKKYQKRVDEDLATGSELGVRGTPGFLIGLTDPDDPGKAQMKVYIKGAQSLDNFKRAIDSLLSDAD